MIEVPLHERFSACTGSHGGVRPFHRKPTCITQLHVSLGLFRTIKWLQFPADFRGNETLVAHRVVGGSIIFRWDNIPYTGLGTLSPGRMISPDWE